MLLFLALCRKACRGLNNPVGARGAATPCCGGAGGQSRGPDHLMTGVAATAAAAAALRLALAGFISAVIHRPFI